jgi:hypothetical protein
MKNSQVHRRLSHYSKKIATLIVLFINIHVHGPFFMSMTLVHGHVLGGLPRCWARRAAVINPSAGLRALLTGARCFFCLLCVHTSSSSTPSPRPPFFCAASGQGCTRQPLLHRGPEYPIGHLSTSLPACASLCLRQWLRPFCLRIKVQDLGFGVFALASEEDQTVTPLLECSYSTPRCRPVIPTLLSPSLLHPSIPPFLPLSIPLSLPPSPSLSLPALPTRAPCRHPCRMVRRG